MIWIILITLTVAVFITNNFTPLKVFGKIMAWFFGIILLLFLADIIIPKILAANDKKEQDAYCEKVKQTPLIQWACDSYGRQLHSGERPKYVYQCSTGELIAVNLFANSYDSYDSYYICQQKPHKNVNHWKYCKHKVNLSNSKYRNLLGN